jgi:hypothetical protein
MTVKFRLYLITIFFFCLTNSTLVNLVYEGLSNLLIILICIFAIADLLKNTTLRSYYFFLFLALLFLFNLFQYELLNIESFQFQLGFYRFFILPLVAYYSVYLTRVSVFKLTDFLFPVILFNIIIVYWRIFFDYTFFGLITLGDLENIGEVYSFGTDFWRPSSLESPIIFSIELSLFVFYYYHQKVLTSKDKINFNILIFFTIIPFLAMRSRSAFIILLGAFFLHFFLNNFRFHKVLYFVIFILIVFPISVYLGLDNVIMLTDDSYSVRGNSLSDSLTQFLNSPTINILFGFGSGHSNFELEEYSGFNVYVENFFASFLIDYGILLTFPFLILNLLLFLTGIINSKNILKISISLFLLVNFFSSNLTAYSLQFFYWILLFEGYVFQKNSYNGLMDFKHQKN